MNLDQFTNETKRMTRRYEYEDGAILAVDFGPEMEASADVADGTVIVVSNGEQYEFDLPEGAADAHTFMKNGVLTVELEGDL
ncbi:Hsp20/alpha crystallin family protein [Natrialbaceae archaeon A-arb3/5]